MTPPLSPEPQLTSTVLLVRPTSFGFNPETAATNAFQLDDPRLTPRQVHERALEEFDAFADQLRQAGVEVVVYDDPGTPPTPDSVFPNNWISFHADGRAVLYPMQAPSRRAERRQEVMALLEHQQGLRIREVVDLRALEEQGHYLEGTGSLVLDRPHRLAYACRSARTHPAAVTAFCEQMGYQPVLFGATDEAGTPVYHTNVLLSIGQNLAIICLEALSHPDEAARVLRHLHEAGHAVLTITREQMRHFAGNMLQLRTRAGTPLLVLSEQAYQSLDYAEQAFLEWRTPVLRTRLDTIERYGGGSARCMLAEVFGQQAA